MTTRRVSPRPVTGGSTAGRLTPRDEVEMDKIIDDGMQRRPSSSASRQAWSDNDGFDIGNEEKGINGDYGDDYGDQEDDGEVVNAPTAMESELYVGGEIRTIDPKVAKQKAEQAKAGCWTKVKRGIRSLWRTRQTDDTRKDKELHVKTTLRELIIYLVFLVFLCLLTFGMTKPTMYYYTKVMSELFLDAPFPDTKNTFRGITTMKDFWRFAETPLVDGLYWEKWYNDDNVTGDSQGYIYYENKLLGVPRIRQVKVTNSSCLVHSDFREDIKQCYAHYSESVEDTQPFGLMNGTAWEHSSEESLDGSGHSGRLASYGGGGYYLDLTHEKADSLASIIELKQNLWLDRGTRAVMVDFSVYNANINLFCIVRLVVEFPPTGGAIPSWTFRTVKLLRYVTAFDYFIMACEGIFALFILYYIVEEILEIKVHRLSYFKSTWNCLDVIIIIVSVVCMAFYVYRALRVDEMIEDLLSRPDQYSDFEFLGYCQSIFNNVIAVAVFLAWIKVFKYISFNKTMNQLSSTLSKCAKDVGGFTIMFLIIFLAYAQFGYLVFGTQIKDFSSVGDCIFTLLRIVLGDFNFHELQEANRVLGPIFFMTYVFVVFFVLLNMFLAIINDTYSEVKADIANQKSEFELTDYFKKGYEKMVGKLNFKRDKIADIQEALAHADANADQHLDFDEWRHELKCRGHADAEIEAVFAKYDVDGDRILDAEEQMKMAADLEGQKTDLNNQLAELEEAQVTTTNRPQTASAGRSKSRVSFNDGLDSDDEDSQAGGGRGGVSGVSYEEFVVLSRRVDRMEHSIGSIVSKIDAVLVKLEAMERAKLKRRETMGKLLDSITEDESSGGNVKREQMERLVREELERWDSDASFSQTSGRAASRGGSAQRSRPGSSGSQRLTLGNASRSSTSMSRDTKSRQSEVTSPVSRAPSTTSRKSSMSPRPQTNVSEVVVDVDVNAPHNDDDDDVFEKARAASVARYEAASRATSGAESRATSGAASRATSGSLSRATSSLSEVSTSTSRPSTRNLSPRSDSVLSSDSNNMSTSNV
ncbi:polycystic kidney disease 2-like 1 protein isoform X3 [Patiria miniata]|uniref:EF-hand domain-containing protein n=1 Tax=Patiria miniata TaxID=46514 RepID=A0A914A986_PATMI|nr:polycystic kidney disease 2-like 1 protein isoform X3 [Patiria miniata]